MPTRKYPTESYMHRGRFLNIDPGVVKWRKKNNRFLLLKKKLLDELLKAGFDKEKTQEWLNTVQPELRNRTPKQLLNRDAIEVLYKWAKKNLRSYTVGV
jgi:hypothetical protein